MVATKSGAAPLRKCLHLVGSANGEVSKSANATVCEVHVVSTDAKGLHPARWTFSDLNVGCSPRSRDLTHPKFRSLG
jgi:hypothetical protein